MSDTNSSVVAIDIGTHKVSVLIGNIRGPDQIEVTGMAHKRNHGMSKGKIISLEKMVSAIKNAVQDAENMAECRVHSAWIAIPSTELRSVYAFGRTPIENSERSITTTEVVRTLDLAKTSHMTADYYLTSAVPLGFSVDDSPEWVPSPIGLSGHSITGHYHLMMLPISTMQNLGKAMRNVGIAVEKMVISSLATSEASLLKDEKEYGVCLIDIGGGTTNLAVYIGGHLAASYTLPIGGESVTRDIATVLKTTTEEAERLKILHGCVDLTAIKPDHMISVATTDGMTHTISRIEFAEIVKARYDDIFDQIHHILHDSGALQALAHGVVLSGDASQIEGAVVLARAKLGVTAHLGNAPTQVTCKDEQLANLRRSMYNTASGLLLFSQSELQQSVTQSEDTKGGAFDRASNRVNRWLSKLKEWF